MSLLLVQIRFQGHRCLRDYANDLLEAANLIASTALESKDKKKKALVIFSGAGTSGRLCWLACQVFRSHFAGRLGQEKLVRCECSLAGGNQAFKKSVEHAEDDEHSARKALDEIVRSHGVEEVGREHVVLVGVTCGMSATWVASQMMKTLEDGGKAVLLGFTPFSGCRGMFARPDVYFALTGKDKGGKEEDAPGSGSAAKRQRLEGKKVFPKENIVILDPVVGPELVTGSTRLKSGTATKICLEIIIATAWRIIHRPSNLPSSSEEYRDFRMSFIQKLLHAYEFSLRIHDCMLTKEMAGKRHPLTIGSSSLMQGGRIIYAGFGREGLLGLIDASEQLPTFGCLEDDFQGFLLDPILSQDTLEVIGKERTLSQFYKTLAKLDSKDTLVLVFNFRRLPPELQTDVRGDAMEMFDSIKFRVSKSKFSIVTYAVLPAIRRLAGDSGVIDWISEISDAFVRIPFAGEASLDEGSPLDPNFADLPAEIAIKSALNCFSSGCNILNGKVYGNRMIDVRLSNTKLVERATQIVMRVAQVSRAAAVGAIKKVLGLEGEFDEQQCISVGSKTRKVVPRAILVATGMGLDEATTLLTKNVKINQIIYSQM